EMDMAVDAAGGGDQVFAGDDLRPGTDDQFRIDPGLNQRIAGLADPDNAPIAYADVAFDDPPVSKHDRVGDDKIELWMRPCAGRGRLSLAVADDLAAAELDFVAVDGVIFLDLDNQFGIGQANAVADGWTVVAGI